MLTRETQQPSHLLKKLKAIVWLALFPLFFICEVLFALAEHDYSWRHYWATVLCFWHAGAYTHNGKVFDKQNNQLYPRPQDV